MFFKNSVMLAAMFVVAACGAGGGGGGQKLTVELTPSPLIASFAPDALPASVRLRGTIIGKTPNRPIYLVFSDQSGLFVQGTVPLYIVDDNAAEAELTVPRGTDIGHHAGRLRLQVCADSTCSDVLVDTGVAYDIEVTAPVIKESTSLELSAMQGDWLPFQLELQGADQNELFYLQLDDAENLLSIKKTTLSYRESHFVDGQKRYVYDGRFAIRADASNSKHVGSFSAKLCADSACEHVVQTLTLPYRIQVWSLVAGAIGESGSAVDGARDVARFCGPVNLSFDSTGNLYVAETCNGDIRRIAPDGTVSTPVPGPLPNAPRALVIDEQGNIFVADDAAIRRIAAGSTAIETFRETPAEDLVLGADGQFYGTSGARPFRLSKDGSQYTEFISGTTFADPIAIALDGTNPLYLALREQQVYRITLPDQVTPLDPDITYLNDLLVDADHNVLALSADSGLYRIGGSRQGSELIASPPELSSGARLTPSAMTPSPDGALYFVDSNNNIIVSTKP